MMETNDGEGRGRNDHKLMQNKSNEKLRASTSLTIENYFMPIIFARRNGEFMLAIESIIRKTHYTSWFNTNHESGKLRHVDGVGSTILAGGDVARSDLMKTQRSDVLICCWWVDVNGELGDVLRPTRPASRRRNLSTDLKSKSLICSPSKSTPPMPWSGKGAAWMLARSIKDHKNKKTQTPERVEDGMKEETRKPASTAWRKLAAASESELRRMTQRVAI